MKNSLLIILLILSPADAVVIHAVTIPFVFPFTIIFSLFYINWGLNGMLPNGSTLNLSGRGREGIAAERDDMILTGTVLVLRANPL